LGSVEGIAMIDSTLLLFILFLFNIIVLSAPSYPS
jgi:hypothetical protein